MFVSRGFFTMENGKIFKNNASQYGGGVYISNGTFTMNSGVISENFSTCGGGVYSGNTFTMTNGIISSNTASIFGGGVFLKSASLFNKTGGTIFGYTFDNNDSNMVRNTTGIVQDRKGHAVFVDYSIIPILKDSDSGQEVNLSWNGTVNPPAFSGGWDY